MATSEITRMASSIIPSNVVINQYDLATARAAMRDIGMIAASIRRHGVQPDAFPRLRDTLLALASLTNEVPRDTVFTYGLRNPEGERQRKFTMHAGESLFIKSFTEGMGGLNECLLNLIVLQSEPLGSGNFLEACKAATSAFESMVKAIVQVKKKVSPELFTYELRPYFDPIEVNGISYLAPGGAQMPIMIVDQMLWGSDDEDESYISYRNEAVQYVPPYLHIQKLGQK